MEKNTGKDLWDFEVPINTDGKAKFETVLIEEDAYDATIRMVDAVEMPVFENPTAEETKIVFQIAIDGKEVELPYFIKPYIVKSSGAKFSNSKLYDLLDKAGVIAKVPDYQEQIKKGGSLRLFLEKFVVGRRVRAQVKTSNKGKENAYSRVADVIRFLDVLPAQ